VPGAVAEQRVLLEGSFASPASAGKGGSLVWLDVTVRDLVSRSASRAPPLCAVRHSTKRCAWISLEALCHGHRSHWLSVVLCLP
jgi:hypothetical protein